MEIAMAIKIINNLLCWAQFRLGKLSEDEGSFAMANDSTAAKGTSWAAN